jgi:4-aminobutyrate aminotransferase-like enzyme
MPNDDATRILELKSTYTIPCLYHFYKDPPVLERGEMQYLFDTEGKRYLDCYAGVTVMNCGHVNPRIIEPTIAQLRKLQHTTSIYLTEPMYALARELVAFLDCGLKRVFFVNSGTEANEGALLLAKLYTGRSGFISLRGGLHGRTSLTMGLTGIPMWQTDATPPPNLFQAPRPHCPSCDLGKTFPSCSYACLDAVTQLLERHGEIAAVIAEPIQGNGGVIVPPDGYFEELQKRVHAAGALLIMDEVQTGMCRTGKRFAFQHSAVEPDILTLAKALGNGFPIGAFCAREEIAVCYTKPGASTTGGNAVSATAARSVLSYMLERDLAGRAAELGAKLRRGLLALQAAFPAIFEVRGRGLMLAAELQTGRGDEPQVTDAILEAMKDRGFLIGKTGLDRNVLTFMPPLIIEASDIDALLAALRGVLTDVLGRS